MVQDLSLFASVTDSQYQLTLDSFATLTGSRPEAYSTLVMLTSPKVVTKFEPNSKTTQHEQNKLHFRTQYNESAAFDPTKYEDWTIQTFDVPFVNGKRKISHQNVLESSVNVNNGNILVFLNDLGYKPDLVYLIKGVKFYHGDITLDLFQPFVKRDGGLLSIDEGLYVLKAFIKVEKSTDVENLTKASQELLNLQKELQGLVELETPDRNLMDSRIGIRK